MKPILVIHKKQINTKNFKNCLLKRVKNENTINKLIEYVTIVPKDDDSENRKYLFFNKVSS